MRAALMTTGAEGTHFLFGNAPVCLGSKGNSLQKSVNIIPGGTRAARRKPRHQGSSDHLHKATERNSGCVKTRRGT